MAQGWDDLVNDRTWHFKLEMSGPFLNNFFNGGF